MQQGTRGLDAELGEDHHDADHGLVVFLGPALKAFVPRVGLVRAHIQPRVDVIDQEAATHAEALGEMAELMCQHAEELLAAQPGDQRQADGQHLAAAEETRPAAFEVHAGIHLVGHFQGHRRADADGAGQYLYRFCQSRLVGGVERQRAVPAAAPEQHGTGQKKQQDAAAQTRHAINEDQGPEAVHPPPGEQVGVAEIPVQDIGQRGHQAEIEQRYEHAAQRHQAQVDTVERARPAPGKSLGEACSQVVQRVAGGLGLAGRTGLRFLAGVQAGLGQRLVPALGVLRIQSGLDHALRRRQQCLDVGRVEPHLPFERIGDAFNGVPGKGTAGEPHEVLVHGSPLRDFFRCRDIHKTVSNGQCAFA